jgi:PAS domain S-box-containing protein
MFDVIINPQNYNWGVYAILYLTASGVYFLSGLFVFLSGEKRLINFSFFLVSVILSVYLVSGALMYASAGKEQAEFINRYILMFATAAISPAILFLTGSFLGILKRIKWIVAASFVVMFFLPLIELFRPSLFWTGANPHWWGWQSYQDGPLAYVFLIILFGIGGYSFFLLGRALKREKDTVKKRRIFLLIVGYSFGYFGGLDILADYGIIDRPYGFIFELLSALFLFYVGGRLRLFEVGPASAAKIIISASKDAIMLVNRRFEIVFLNDAALKMMGGKRRGNFFGKSVGEVLAAEKLSDKLTKSGVVKDGEIVFSNPAGKKIYCSMNASVISGENGPVGYVIFLHDMSRLRDAMQELENKNLLLKEAESELCQKIENLEKFSKIAENRAPIMKELEEKIRLLEKKKK